MIVLVGPPSGIGLLLPWLQGQLFRHDFGQPIGSALDLAGEVDVGLILLQVIGRLGLALGAVHGHRAQLAQGALANKVHELHNKGRQLFAGAAPESPRASCAPDSSLRPSSLGHDFVQLSRQLAQVEGACGVAYKTLTITAGWSGWARGPPFAYRA